MQEPTRNIKTLSRTHTTRIAALKTLPNTPLIHTQLADVLLCNPHHLEWLITGLARVRGWAPPTIRNRLGLLIHLANALGTDTAILQQIVLKRLLRRHSRIQTPTWNPQDPHQVLSKERLRIWLKTIKVSPDLKVPVILAWILGQRISDVLLWRVAQVTRTPGTHHGLTICVIEHKTTGAYCLHLPSGGLAKKLLGSWLRFLHTETSTRIYLFLESLHTLNPDEAAEQRRVFYRRLKAETGWSGDVRAIRRGGLITMADLPNMNLMALTRHKSAATLRKYLGAGLHDRHERFLQKQCIEITEKALT